MRKTMMRFPWPLQGIRGKRSTREMIWRCFLFCLWVGFPSTNAKCPLSEVMDPCICKEQDQTVQLTCQHQSDIDKLQRTVRTVSDMVSRLWLNDCSLGQQQLDVALNLLANLTSLQELHLSANGLIKLPAEVTTSLRNITILDVSHNEIESLPELNLWALTELRSLDISHNRMSNFGEGYFRVTRHLEILNLSHNNINQIPINAFEGIKSLQLLDLSNNQLMALAPFVFKELGRLKVLLLSDNQLMSFSMNALTEGNSLQFLELRNNSLTDRVWATVARMTALINLDLSFNEIEQVGEDAMSKLISLDSLNLRGNFIDDLPDAIFSKLENLQQLDISQNKLEWISSEAFQHIPLLQLLNLSTNSLNEIAPKAFAGCALLRILDLSENRLEDVTGSISGHASLEELHLSRNPLRALFNISIIDLPALKTLTLQHANLTHIGEGAFENLFSLQTLDLSRNRIQSIASGAFRDLPNLMQLRLSENSLTSLPSGAITDLVSVREIYLDENAIHSVSNNAFRNLPSIRVLNLSSNQLEEPPKEALLDLPSVDTIDLSNNNIQFIDDSFSALEWLRALMLQNNRLCRIDEGSFSNQNTLKILNLANNNIHYLNEEAFQGLKDGLQNLDLTDNPLICDCFHTWLFDWLSQPSFHGHVTAVCDHPSQLQGQPIQELQRSMLNCNGKPEVKIDCFDRRDGKKEQIDEPISVLLFTPRPLWKSRNYNQSEIMTITTTTPVTNRSDEATKDSRPLIVMEAEDTTEYGSQKGTIQNTDFTVKTEETTVAESEPTQVSFTEENQSQLPLDPSEDVTITTSTSEETQNDFIPSILTTDNFRDWWEEIGWSSLKTTLQTISNSESTPPSPHFETAEVFYDDIQVITLKEVPEMNDFKENVSDTKTTITSPSNFSLFTPKQTNIIHPSSSSSSSSQVKSFKRAIWFFTAILLLVIV